MNAFGYLAVLISIVLGLGITNLLTNLAALVRRRARIRFFWPLIVWMLTLLLIHVQTWWAMFTLEDVHRWVFEGFLVVLMQPILLYAASALIVPDFSEATDIVDLRAGFYRESRWFFLTIFLVLVDSLCKDLVLYGRLPEASNFIAHLIFMSITIFGATSHKDRVQKFLAPLGLVLFAGYIALLFTTLPK